MAEKRRSAKRPNGMGGAYKRGRYWQAEISTFYQGHRIRQRKSGFKTKKEALQFIERGGFNAPERKILMEIYLPWSERHYSKISKNRVYSYKKAWERLKPIHYRDINELKFDEMQRIIDGIDSYYVAKYMKFILTQLYREAIKNKITDVNIAEYIELPKNHEETKEPYSLEEVELMWKKLPEIPFLAYPLIMIYTGMRPGELFKLEKKHIDFERNLIIGSGSKTELGQEAPVIFPDIIKPLLENYESLAFRKHQDKFYADYKEAMAAAGLPESKTPGSCRHTCSTWLTSLNTPPALIRRIMRHTSYKTTIRYTHFQVDQEIQALNSMQIKKEAEEP